MSKFGGSTSRRMFRALAIVLLFVIVGSLTPNVLAQEATPSEEPTPTMTPEELASETPQPSPEPEPTPTAEESPTPDPTPVANPSPSAAPAEPPTISSDKDDYIAGERVTLAGANWSPGEVVHVIVNDDAGQTWRYETDVTALDDGTFTLAFNLPSHFVAEYSVVATGPISGTARTTFTDSPVKITATGHEGQEKTGNILGGYTSGNITTYSEGDFINFRFTVSATHGPAEGQIEVHFSGQEANCLFFADYFQLGTIDALSGPQPTITIVDGPTPVGDEWVVTLDIDYPQTFGHETDARSRVNYTLQLSDEAGACTGSSQHSRLNGAGGVAEASGAQNVPVPASQIVELPEITVIKRIDRNGDGTFESTAAAGEFRFCLDGSATNCLLTDAAGQATFVNVTPNGAHTVTETQVSFSLGTYPFASGSGTNCTFSGSTATATVSSGTTSTDASCTFNNGLVAAPALTLVKSTTTTDFDSVGDTISYSYLVTNTGNVSLDGPVTITDDRATATCPNVNTVGNLDAALDPGEAVTCTATYTITQADLNAGSVTNIATASADGTTSNQDTVTVTGTQSPALTLVKSTTTTDFDSVGDTISYSYLVTNTGNVSLDGPVTITDDRATATCPNVNTVGNLDAALDPGEAVTCTATYTITQADLNAGSVTNIATASADGTTSNQDTVTVTGTQSPALTLVKSTTTTDFDSVGDTISYSYLVTNTGNVSLDGPVTITDDRATATCPNVNTVGNLDAALDPGEAVTCTATYTITQADLNAGSVTNIATASADGTTSNQDTVTVTGTQSPALTLVKSTTTTDFDSVGDTISYSYLVTNTGNVSLDGPVTITDDRATATCPNVNTVGNLDAALDPGEAVTCTATYTITQADLNAGSVTNIATASADGTTSNQDTVTVTGTQSPALTLVKSTTTTDFDSVGDTISYSYLVTNTGNVSLDGPVTITDDRATATCPNVNTVGNLDAALDPGEAVTCTATYTITQADLNAGSVTNIATASADGTTSNQDTVTVTGTQSPALTLVKSTTTTDFDSVGDTISYSYLVTNTGNVSLDGPVTITDDRATATCPNVNTVGNLDAALDPGEAVTCTATYTITQADLNAGSVTNIATASADGTTSNQDTVTVTGTQSPALTLVKSTTTTDFDSVGDTISYSYLVTNTGNVSLDGPVTITDDRATATCPNVNTVGNLDAALDPGEAVTCTATYTITQADLNAGSVTNIATASADGTTSNQDTVTVTGTQSPALTLVKSTTTTDFDSVGDTISYSYLVTNTGNVSLDGPVTITDDRATATCPNVNTVGNLDAALDPGEAVTCTATYTITQADLNAGSVTNIATASADGTTSNQDTVTVTGTQSPALTLVKSTTTTDFDSVGDTISYSYLVTNTGNVSLDGPVTITDDRATATCPNVNTVGNLDAALDPGEAVTCTATYTITQADLNAGSVTNIATASADGTTSNQDTVTVTGTQSPALTLVKSTTTTDFDSVGDTISYSYLVTNTGNVSLDGPVTITDDRATATCPNVNTVGNLDAALDPGEAVTCTATYTITQADLNAGSVTNIATASADGTTSNQDTVTVTGTQSPALTLVKSTTTTDFDSVGDTISYSYLVTNTGNVSLDGPVTITDDRATATCPNVNTVGNLDAALDPGEAVTCTATYTITQADLNAGSVTNIATASADGTTSNQDTVTVTGTQSPALTLVKSTTTTDFDSVGDTISYSYLVTNTGNVSLDGPVTITDDRATATCPNVNTVGNLDAALDPGEAVTCTATYTITQADLNAGSVTNIATASADGTTSNQDTVTVTGTQSPALTLVKSTTTTDFDSVGDTISYSYLVTNTGNVSLDGPVTITDDRATATCPNVNTVGNLDAALDPGEAVTCTATYTITQADLNAGSVTNIATASADGTTSNQDTVTVTGTQSPALTLVKSTTTTDFDSVGDTISYSYLVTNTGNVSLDGPVTITDDRATATCPNVNTVGNLDAALDPGEAVTCTATYTITQADLNAGSVTNIATASADGTTSNQDTVTVTGTQSPALTLVKSTTTTDFDSVGDTISYSYLVTNTGNVSLDGPVTITDDRATATCPNVNTVGNLDAALDPGEAVTCTATYTITQADLNAGSVTNIATASADGTTSNQDTVTVTGTQSPALTLVKSTTTTDFDSVGDTISYSYLVTNTGNVSLDGPVTITDDRATATCPNVNTVGNLDAALDPGEAVTCTATYTITQADLNAGSVTNIATASADGTTSNQDTVTVTGTQSPALTLVKSTTTTDFDSVGDTISYSYLVTNTGNVSLDGPVTITDDRATATCPNVNTVGNLDAALDPGEAVTCTATYTITQADLNAGSVTNIATASADGTTSNQDTVTVTGTQSPALTLVKSTTTTDFDSVGDTISYSYLVTNTGNVSLDGPVTITDDRATATCPNVNTVGNLDAALDPGEAVTCTATYTITQADLNAGSVTNIATASADGTTSNQDTVTVTGTQSPALTLVKSTTTTDFDSVGDTISYSYLVTNTGNVSLDGPVTITDDRATATCPNVNTVGNLDAALDPGEAVTCTATYTITQADLNAGSVTNIATASADGTTSNQDTVTVTGTQSPALTLDKSADPTTYDQVGDIITYTYLVTNTGNVTIQGPFSITDDKSSDESCPATASLEPGQSITCTATYTITAADMTATQVTNVAFATGTFDGQAVQSNNDSATVNRLAAETGARTIGFWQNKNGQSIITSFCQGTSGTSLYTFLRGFKPFQDLSKTACRDVAAYVTTVIKNASSRGASMNAMLKAQMLATALNVYFSDPALGGNRLAAPQPIGGLVIDLTAICKMSTSGCNGTYRNVSAAFGGATSLTVSQMLTVAASNSSVGGGTWYGNVKATQEMAKDAFDAINNEEAFVL